MPARLTPREVVELFHLVFVRALFASLPDKRLIAVKGGINLRFYFQSVRFSEDLDLDVMTIAKRMLENRVDKLLQSPALVQPLKARAVRIVDRSKPKQTETVQKWKLALSDGVTEHRTKIEFSRRDDTENAKLEPVDRDLANRYSVPAFLATHYQTADAVRQKIHALKDRSETQPRDVFDLHVLLARQDAPTELDVEAASWIEEAVRNAAGLSYEQYLALVVAYLEPAHQAVFGSTESWELMQAEVIERLDALR